ncbi:MAG: DNA adenine methylase [Bacteroidaceae bacterium]|nr:DNA adenine methylase [Bacteroidaceae bacterium]
MVKAKPFIKWVGGKGQLIEQLEALLPPDFAERDNVTYIEPFVGGGAMLFYMLQNFPNIKSAVINDINQDLMLCYKVVRDNPTELVELLNSIQCEYYALNSEEERKIFFLKQRELFNTKTLSRIENTALFFFLNKTCYNGLYRVNKSGKFNVPFGKYVAPTICDAKTIYADSKLLQNVEIMTGDFEQTLMKIKGDTFFYFDPPYRPLSSTSNFNDYAKDGFNDEAQIRLKLFCDRLNEVGVNFMLSNSDCLATNGTDRFFDDLFAEYKIERVWASRNVNAIASKRGKIKEIVVNNYHSNYLFQSQML